LLTVKLISVTFLLISDFVRYTVRNILSFMDLLRHRWKCDFKQDYCY